MTIYCCGCEKNIKPRLTNGRKVYPHRQDLWGLPFWECPTCLNYVGTHNKTKDRFRPLGVIPTPEIMNARKAIHRVIDPLWQANKIKRAQAYAYVTHRLGYTYHTGEIKSLDEARTVYRIVTQLHNELLEGSRVDAN